MFERYLTDALTTHFGHFIENLDADKVRLSAWNGELVLQDLSLKAHALDHFLPGCPVEIAHGRVGNLELRIPWSLFRSQLKFSGGQRTSRYVSTTAPCSIVLSDVNILITPRRRRDADENSDEASDWKNEKPSTTTDEERIRKEKEVQSLLDGHLLRRVTESSGGGSTQESSSELRRSSRWSWVRDWISTLLSTLSVTVRNIHVRYEDAGTCMGFMWDGQAEHYVSSQLQYPPTSLARRYRPSFAVGITLRQFSIQSDYGEEKKGEDKDDLRTSSSTSSNIATSRRGGESFIEKRKIAAAERLAIYWDSDCNLMAVHSDILCESGSEMQYGTYYQSAFQVVNSTVAMAEPDAGGLENFGHRALYAQEHSFVLDPISPHVYITLVSPKEDKTRKVNKSANRLESIDSMDELDDSSTDEDGSTIAQEPQLIMANIPASTMKINLPPCKLTLDRSTLEDTAYIRKSLSIWKHATRGLLSEATLRRLAKLRPASSPVDDPRRWWFYAIQATIALSRVDHDGKDVPTSVTKQNYKRRRGWKGFWNAFRRRKRYVELYESLRQGGDDNEKTSLDYELEFVHRQLLELEDGLASEEIVAFRLALYDRWKAKYSASPFMSKKLGEKKAGNRNWSIWTATQTTDEVSDITQGKGPILSLEHRVAMMLEMSRALERERTNDLKFAKAESIRQMSMQTFPVFAMGGGDSSEASIDSDLENHVVWKASVGCTEIAIQVNDEAFDTMSGSSSRTTPVIRFSCAWIQEQCWYEDDSWDIDCTLASLVVKDLTVSKNSVSNRYFPNLIAGKHSRQGTEKNGSEVVFMSGKSLSKSISVAVQKRLHWSRPLGNGLFKDNDRGSTTTSRIRILPMELVYSTVPVEVATRVLGTVKTPELVDDYHRMASAAHGWQQRQKKKILAALAHKSKKIFVDVDVGAPEILIPENINRPDSSMLAIDLGRLRFLNEEHSNECPPDFDDHWRLIVSNVQVRSGSVAAFAQGVYPDHQQSIMSDGFRQLVEPFSLSFHIATKIVPEASREVENLTKIHVGATLPRLAFNLNSSSIRLISRLQNQFERRRNRRKRHLLHTSRYEVPSSQPDQPLLPAIVPSTGKSTQIRTLADNPTSSRILHFEFTAPVIGLRLGSDSGDIPRTQIEFLEEVPLLDLSFHGIRGSLKQTVASDGESILVFDAKLRSLTAIDLYQKAGNDYEMLLSSSVGSTYQGGKTSDEGGKDLVAIQYTACSSSHETQRNAIPDKVVIGFNELYVEWNPESLAAIQRAIRIPKEEGGTALNQASNLAAEDEFFDALEEVSVDIEDYDESFRLVSEVASSSFETAEGGLDASGHSRRSSLSPSVFSLAKSFSGQTQSPSRRAYSTLASLSPRRLAYPPFLGTDTGNPPTTAPAVDGKSLQVVFELSRLRVSFNKESRHRKVMIAQMDGTRVSFQTRKAGGSLTKIKIGNLVFIDPSSSRNGTLYGEILGLKNKSTTNANLSSLLEMEMLVNPTSRSYAEGLNPEDDDATRPVAIDRENGVVTGCNNFFKARFSPMRFVFLEQLWFEIIDYFFEGIMGSAVWTGERQLHTIPAVVNLQTGSSSEGHFLPGSDAKGFSFTRFRIQLQSPEVLLPVAYRSPHFLRLDLSSIDVANRYDVTVLDDVNCISGCRMQWFNSCTIALDRLQISSWTGRKLGKCPVGAKISLRWPTGPNAGLVTPKWNVDCQFDTLQLSLRREDYGLVQQIISSNIGEASRHLDEWEALQALSTSDYLAYAESVLVHFGYDKKDVTPTTYDLRINFPSLIVDFIAGDDDSKAEIVAVSRCTSLSWSLRKDSDLVVKQTAVFDVDLVVPSMSGVEKKLLSTWTYVDSDTMPSGNARSEDRAPELSYTSTTLPSGDNVKTLSILDASIYANISEWRHFSNFFSGLSEPVLFEEEEIGSSIQVGDRWYKIGSGSPKASETSSLNRPKENFAWIVSSARSHRIFSEQEILRATRKENVLPTFQLRLLLTAPQIVLSSSPIGSIVSHVVLRMEHLDFLHSNSGDRGIVTKSFMFDQVEVYTLSKISGSRKKPIEGGGSLIHPWSVGGMIEKCNGINSGNCKKHCSIISADTLKARAAYSDMAVALEVCLSVVDAAKAEKKGSENIQSRINGAPAPSSSTKDGNQEDKVEFCQFPDLSVLQADCEGFEFSIADDSGRHFATNQELIKLSLGRILFNRKDVRGEPSTVHLRVECFDLYDNLQSDMSRFRLAATTRLDILEGKPLQSCDLSPQAYHWGDMEMARGEAYKFKPSLLFESRLRAASSLCDTLEEEVAAGCRRTSIDLSRRVDGIKSQNFRMKLDSLSVQYNPSTVIAIQRFLGRLRKEFKTKIASIVDSDVVGGLVSTNPDIGSKERALSPIPGNDSKSQATVEALVDLGSLKVCLNKEHQNRRLLELKLSSCQLRLLTSEDGMIFRGGVGSLAAFDPDTHSHGILESNRHLLRVIPSSQGGHQADGQFFLRLHYSTFKSTPKKSSSLAIPRWVQDHTRKIGGIDDFLSIQVASTQFIFLKERTEELVDYLSNGLPGKGMGVTSRAAKGFITKRILTKSFLEFQNDSPQIFVPRDELSSQGLSLRLGDVIVKSYFDEDTSSTASTRGDEWWRLLSFHLSGFQVGLSVNYIFSAVTSPIDLGIDLKRPTSKGGEMMIRGNLSLVDLVVKYSYYVLICSVVNDNVGKKVDADKWDNVEKAYESEDHDVIVFSSSVDGGVSTTIASREGGVAYSSNARLIRYGRAGKRQAKLERQNSLHAIGSTDEHISNIDVKATSTIDLKFTLDGLSLKLSRDDPVDAMAAVEEAADFCYDIVLLRVQMVETTMKTAENGDVSFHLSLFRLGLFDLGDAGRRFREYYLSLGQGITTSRGPRRPCPFCIIAEGYTPGENPEGKAPVETMQEVPQLVVTVEQRLASAALGGSLSDLELPAKTKMTVARIVVNYLSLNMLLRPVKETLSFLACDWPLSGNESFPQKVVDQLETDEKASAIVPPKGPRKSEALQMTLVAHYPRIFFLADESDEHSRALVLRGLAVVNLNKITRAESNDLEQHLSSTAQLHSLESYINADVHDVMSFKREHVAIVGVENAPLFPSPREDVSSSDRLEGPLGVALIQPVTAGLEFSERKRPLFPTTRSLHINIEPVSTMLSFEDLNLIETVAARLSSKKKSKVKEREYLDHESEYSTTSSLHTPLASTASNPVNPGTEAYQVIFQAERLGLGLKSIDGRAVITNIQNEEHAESIGVGDVLIAIGGLSCADCTLDDIVRRLSGSDRPVTLTFCPSSSTRHASPGTLGLMTPPPLDGSEKMTKASDQGGETSLSITCKVLTLLTGESGLQLERSVCGGLPLVSKVLPSFAISTNQDTEEVRDEGELDASCCTPRPGAVIAAINGVSLIEIGLDKAWAIISSLGQEESTQSSAHPMTYALTFVEIDSAIWGVVENVNLSSAGFALSFIDDLNGRDMPLFRGKLDSLELRAERGIGVRSQIIEVGVPSILQYATVDTPKLGESMILVNPKSLDELRHESVSCLSAVASCSIDYFHPKVAVWEPLVERSQLSFFLERQNGSAESGRAGQVAIEVSDQLLRDQSFRSGSLPSISDSPKAVTFNLTDASAEVAAKALSQWKKWRVSKILDAEEDEGRVEIEIDDLNVSDEQFELSGSFESPKAPSQLASTGSPRHLHGVNTPRDAKRMAAQRAAQAALVFAKKRGAERSKKSDSAKPFVFRNRTGVSIAFVAQQCGHMHERDHKVRHASDLTAVGEYQGLDTYDSSHIQELADKEDARFSLDVVDGRKTTAASSPATATKSKLRNYEGRFPSLTVAIQAVSGITIQPLTDLQVFKFGSTVRHLLVRKELNDDGAASNSAIDYSIPVVWKVEIEDNRRVLTLSTAIRVVTTAFSTEMEIGIQFIHFDEPIEKSMISASGVSGIGTIRQDSPFYLPLWVALKLEPVNVFVRPKAAESSLRTYYWGDSSILRFGPLVDDRGRASTWVWEEAFEELDYIRCDPTGEDGSPPCWLAVFSGSLPEGDTTDSGGLRRISSVGSHFEEEHREVISVTIDSSVTLRNLLPMYLNWQIGHLRYGSSTPEMVDGSTARSSAMGGGRMEEAISFSALPSGVCTESFACDFQSHILQARFSAMEGRNWSEWAPLQLDELFKCDEKSEDGEREVRNDFPRARQINVQIADGDFGIPMTVGVRLVPKMTLGSLGEISKSHIYGVEIIVYAELWIRNITALPLNFGCPSAQLHRSEQTRDSTLEDNATRFNAESALMEIASLLEVGDKGTGFDRKDIKGGSLGGDIESLPLQQCDELWEEVFEYLEIEYSTVKRRWWASENYCCFRENITQLHQKEKGWRWIDENWSIDTAGKVDEALGGWESSRGLLASEGSFSLERTFEASHSIRRRRFFRKRTGGGVSTGDRKGPMDKVNAFEGGIQAMHHPLHDTFSQEQQNAMRKSRADQKGDGKAPRERASRKSVSTQIAVKCGDGRWSTAAAIPSTGTSHGVFRVMASRWPPLTANSENAKIETTAQYQSETMFSPFTYQPGNLSSSLLELCYTVVEAEGDWGEFSKVLTVSPRFMMRNDSARLTMAVKQAAAPGRSSLKLLPGEVVPFYWEDFRLPGLVCVTPQVTNGNGGNVYKWSGGFDLCNLGMVPLRIRKEIKDSQQEDWNVQSIRALVEIRPGTGGFGMIISFREEDSSGDGALFRVENVSPFPIWLAQDGVLANPSKSAVESPSKKSSSSQVQASFAQDYAVNGDIVRSAEKSVFALDVPYRQGKYSHRKEATLKELLRIRVALAPFTHRAGVETLKVASFTSVGETIRLNPSKLFGILEHNIRVEFEGIRVLAVVCSDGPTKVLRLCLVKIDSQDLIGKTIREVSYMASKQGEARDIVEGSPRAYQSVVVEEIRIAASDAMTQSLTVKLPSEEDATRRALVASMERQLEGTLKLESSVPDSDGRADIIYSVRVEFNGFLFSMVDSAPSEIAVATLRNFNALARWNAHRTNEASLIMSVGWLQVDNHVPSAPFKVAVRPDSAQQHDHSGGRGDSNSDENIDTSPLLMVAVAFAPRHKSEIVCLRSVTVAPRNLVIAVDLAFLVRLQRYALGIKTHIMLSSSKGDTQNSPFDAAISALHSDQKRNLTFPKLESAQEGLRKAAAIGTKNQKLYFQGLTILPAAITLSVAPARALTPAQAALEGKEVAAIHQAVRKGDVLVGSSSALLGVRVGRTNTTPLAVVRGVFKSIVVDAILRLDGASLQFSGVTLRNHISTGPQLGTYLATHYLASLRQNVPALLGSLAAFGNPLGLIRGLGDGMSDFVSHPVRGLKKSVKELDPSYLVDGVARGTGSLARHTVGGFADSASLLTETFSKNMAVLTLDRRYAQKRDQSKELRLDAGTTVTIASGVESGFIKLVQGFMEGVTGVVKAPMRGAEKKGIEGFAKGLGKGLLGLLVKPIIGISDAATDVMIGVRNSVENSGEGQQQNLTLDRNQFRPRRPVYGRDKILRPYSIEDAAAAALMLRTRCAGENYLSHLDLGDRVALLSVKRFILLGSRGQELMALKYKHVSKLEVRQVPNEDNSLGWAIIIVLNTPRKNGSEVEVLSCTSQHEATELCSQIQRGVDLVASARAVY